MNASAKQRSSTVHITLAPRRSLRICMPVVVPSKPPCKPPVQFWAFSHFVDCGLLAACVCKFVVEVVLDGA